jgi:hypothetical protein
MTIQQFMHENNHTLGPLLTKLNLLKKWNSYLRESLGSDVIIADHCQIVNLVDNAFIVIADNPLWLTRIRFYVPNLLPLLRAYPGLEKLKAICCKVHPSYVPHKKRKPRAAQKKLSQKTSQEVNDIANKIMDPELRDSLKKIAEK